jgi:hypothetical protein
MDTRSSAVPVAEGSPPRVAVLQNYHFASGWAFGYLTDPSGVMFTNGAGE